jgi:alcohol dehydrogenase class IV
LKEDAYIKILLDTIDRYVTEFDIPRLSEFGIGEKDILKIVEATGLKNHPVKLGDADLGEIVRARL